MLTNASTHTHTQLRAHVCGHQVFAPVVTHNLVGGMAAPRLDWSSFHITYPLSVSNHWVA